MARKHHTGSWEVVGSWELLFSSEARRKERENRAREEEKHKQLTQERIRRLLSLAPKEYEHWKYYEERADRLGDRLWTIGIWLISVPAAALALPFAAHLIEPTASILKPHVASPVAVILVSIFGIVFCLYGYVALKDMRQHIKSNWRNAAYVLNKTWSMNWGGRKSAGFSVLMWAGTMAIMAFTAMLIFAARSLYHHAGS